MFKHRFPVSNPLRSIVDNPGYLSWIPKLSILAFMAFSAGTSMAQSTGNLPPVAVVGPDQTVPAGTIFSIDGRNSTDDGTIKSYDWRRTGGTGTSSASVTSRTEGKLDFLADQLNPGDAGVTYVFELVVTDHEDVRSEPAQITITAVPASEIDAGPNQRVLSGTTVTLDGRGASAAHGAIESYRWFQRSSTGASVVLSDQTAVRPTFRANTLRAGDNDVRHVFELNVLVTGDTNSNVSWNEYDDMHVTVTASDLPLVEAGPDRTVKSGSAVVLDGTGTKVISGRTITTWAWSSDTVTLTDANTSGPSFTADTLKSDASDVSHTITLTVTDSLGKSNTDTVTITVEPKPNILPVAIVGRDQTIPSGVSFSIDGRNSTDQDGDVVSYAWRRVGGTAGNALALIDSIPGQMDFHANQLNPGNPDETYIFELIVTDNEGGRSEPALITITAVAGTSVDAGPDLRVLSGTTVTLDGSRSITGHGTITSHTWQQRGGTGGTVTLSDANAVQPTYRANILTAGDPDVRHVFQLGISITGINTNVSWKEYDDMHVTVTTSGGPLANAGEDLAVQSGSTIVLDGTGSAVLTGRTITSWAWTSDTATLTGGDTSRPTLVADILKTGDANVTHVFTLTITDNLGQTDTDTVTVTVEAVNNKPPVAVLGPDQTVPSGLVVTLDGRNSIDPGGEVSIWSWRRVGGTASPRPISSDEASGILQFWTDHLVAGDPDITYVFELVVTDNEGFRSEPVEITITATYVKEADAGADQRVLSGSTVTLDGSGSGTAYGAIESYRWQLIGGSLDHSATVNSISDINAVQPTFTADTLAEGADDIRLFFQLQTITRGTNTNVEWTVYDNTWITVTANGSPVANAGPDQTVKSGAAVVLDGTGSTAISGRTITSWAWSSNTVTLTDATVSRPTFIADTLGPNAPDVTHTFTLTVTDNLGQTDTDTVTITVESIPGTPPMAVIGADQTVPYGTTVTLDGRRSIDIGGTVDVWSWRRTGGSGDSSLGLSTATPGTLVFQTAEKPSGTPDATHVFELIVTDNDGFKSEPVEITITLTTGRDAYAGTDQTVPSGARVWLDGSGSATRYGTISGYSWQRTGGTGSPVILDNSDTELAVFTADRLDTGTDDVTHEFELRVSVTGNNTNVGWIDSDDMTITVQSPFYPTVVRPGADRYVESGQSITLIGHEETEPRVEIHDRFWVRTEGTGDETRVPEIPGRSGKRGSNTNTLTFTVDTLEPGDDNVTHYFTYNVIDSAGNWVIGELKVTVLSEFRDPIAIAGSDQLVVSGAKVTLDGSGSVTVPGRTISFYSWTRTGGTGNPESVGYPYQPPGEDGSSTPAGWGHHFAPTFTFTADTLASGADDVTHEFLLRVADESGTIVSDRITVTVTASSSPVANAGPDQSTHADRVVTLDSSGSTVSDPRRFIVSRAWRRVGGTGGPVVLDNTGAVQPSFTTNSMKPGIADVTYDFSVVITDNVGEVSTNTDVVTITATSPFATPVANAGPDRTVISGSEVVLDGTGSTTDRRGNLTYAWVRVSGTGNENIVLEHSDTAQPTFIADTLNSGDEDVTHVFRLTAGDSVISHEEFGLDVPGLRKLEDLVVITVTTGNLPPVANAGPDQTVFFGDTVTLDGRDSRDQDGNIVSHKWAWTVGTDNSSVVLIDENTAQSTFTLETRDADAKQVTHIFTLTVTDDLGSIDTDTVRITIMPAPRLPVANAGPDQTVVSGTTFRLDSINSAVDPQRTIKKVTWKQDDSNTHDLLEFDYSVAHGDGFLTGHALQLTAPALQPGAADVPLEFHVHVTDSSDAEARDSVIVTVVPETPPIADAGLDKTVHSGATVFLDGAGSTAGDSRRTLISHAWKRIGGTGGAINLNGATVARPVFVADTLAVGGNDVTHTFELTVTDDLGQVDTDTVTVTVSSLNALPFAITGEDQIVPSGVSVWLDGRNSRDIDGTIASYDWTRTGGTGNNVSLSTVSPGLINFTTDSLAPGDADVTHDFQLIVTDNEGAVSEVATVTITVTPAGGANAGPDQEVPSGAIVELDGRNSSTTYGTIESYAWRRTGGTGGFIALINPHTVQPVFQADTLVPDSSSVTHVFGLQTVTVGRNINISWSEFDEMTVTVIAPPAIPTPDPLVDPGPVANAGDNQWVLSNSLVTLDGTGSTVDVGRRIESYTWVRTGGTGKGVVLNNTAQPTFVADSLNPGDADVTHEFQLVVVDDIDRYSVPDQVKVTVVTSFDDTVANAGPDQSVKSGATVFLDGGNSTSDEGRPITSWSWERIDGTTGGSVTLSDANTERPTFTADTLVPGAESVTHTLELTVRDSAGNTDSDTVVVTVTSPNIIPVAVIGGSQTVPSGSLVSIHGYNSRDDDGTVVSYSWRRTGGTGSTVLVPGITPDRQDFRADTLAIGAEDVTHIFELIVTDNEGAVSEPATMTVTVTPGSDVEAGPEQMVPSGKIATLDGSGSSSPYGTINSIRWDRIGGTGGLVALTERRAIRTTFRAETLPISAADTTHDFELEIGRTGTSNSNVRWVLSDKATVTVTSDFATPVADAGPDQDDVVPGTTVTLDGSASTVDPRRTIRTWAWTSETVTLTDADTSTPTFTADSLEPGEPDVTHVISLIVTDSDNVESSASTVTVTVVSSFRDPVANAGPDQDEVVQGTTVTLDGSASTVDRRREIKTWAWTSETVTLTDSDTSTPTFTADSLEAGDPDVVHVISLVVTDSADVESSASAVTITVVSSFREPVANAGPDQDDVVPGTIVTLDGSGSSVDPRRTVKTWAWTSETVTLTDADTSTPTFTADNLEPGDDDVAHVISLIVTDSDNVESSASTVTVTVVSSFRNPIANAGPDQDEVVQGTTVTLDGSASTVDRRREIKAWAWTSETATLAGANTSTPTFIADSLEAGDPDVVHVISLVVTDSADVESSASAVTITVISSFREPVANAGPDQDDVAPGTTVTLDGSASTVDPRREIKTWAWTSETVTLTDADTSTPTFTADNLAAGDPDVVHEISLVVTDSADVASSASTVTVTVVSSFRNPVANAGPNQDEVVPGTIVTLDGSASTVDPRREIKTWAWTSETATLAGANTSTPTFTADNIAAGDPDVTHVISLIVTDSADVQSSASRVTITVVSSFRNPVANAGPDQDDVVPGTTVTLDGRDSTVDPRRTVKTWAWTSETVTLTDADTSTPTFTADNLAAGNPDVTHVISLIVTDSADVESSASTVTITVVSSFRNPVANAGPNQDDIVPGTIVTLDGSASTVDPRREIKTWAWTSETATLTGANTSTPTFTADNIAAGDPDVTHVISLIVTDSADVESSASAVTITVVSSFREPVANAGPDQDDVVPGTTVTLDGRDSTVDPRRTVKTWAWTSETATLTGANTSTPTFTADNIAAGDPDVTHVISLVVIDSADVESSASTVTVTVVSSFRNPVANAGPNQDDIVPGTIVTLDGSASTVDPRREIKTWAWTSETATLTGANTSTPTFTADSLETGDPDVVHEISLVVTDSADVESSASTVTVTVVSSFRNPVANAGPNQDEVVPGTIVTLDGSASTVDPRREIKAWAWTSETATLTGANTSTPTFTADSLQAGDPNVVHVISLVVTDSADVESPAATVTITVVSSFRSPIANAGPNQDDIVPGTIVTLDGSASTVDPRREIKTWAWTSETATLTGANTSTPTFTADSLEAGDPDVVHVISLVVTDSADVESSASAVTVTVVSSFRNPVANAGPDQDEVVPGTTITLDGSGSSVDPRRTVKTWAWTSETVTLTDADTSTPTFTADNLAAGDPDVTHVISLIVTDSADVESSASTVTVTVVSSFRNPVANAGPDQDEVVPGNIVILDGSGSSVDPRRTVKTWAWSSETATLTGADTSTPTFTADSLEAGDPDVVHEISLVVTDSADVESSASTVTITVVSSFRNPVANAGPDQDEVVPGTIVTLDGSASTVDPRREIKTWAWTSETATLTGANTSTPTFTADNLQAGDPDVVHVISLVVTDSADVESSASRVTITVVSSFRDPVANAGPDQDEVVPGTTVTLDGSGSSVDPRRTVKTWAWSSETATLTGADTSTPTFTADNLEAGDPDVVHVISLIVTDSADVESPASTVTITVVSSFKDPVANAGPDQDEVVPGTTVTLDGSGSSVDPRRTVKTWAWTSETATLTGANTSTPTFTADNLEAGDPDVVHVISLIVIDSADVESPASTVTVTVVSSFRNPVANAGPDQDEIVPGTTVTLDGSGSSVDPRRTVKTWAWTSETATLTGANTSTPTFTADSLEAGDPDIVHVISLIVTDSADLESSASTVTVTVVSSFKDPVADAGPDQDEIVPGTTVTLDGSDSSTDPRRTIRTWAWTSETATLTDANTSTPTFVADNLEPGDADVTHVISLRVTDNGNDISRPDMVEITIVSDFAAPMANAGTDLEDIVPGSTVVLDGSASTVDRRRNIRTWAWSSETVTLTGANTSSPTFTADNLKPDDADVIHMISLVITDDAGDISESDEVGIIITSDFAAPVANAGPDQEGITTGTTVQLDGSASLAGKRRSIRTWAWTSDTATLTGANTSTPTFVADNLEPGDADVTHVISLRVTDNADNVSEPDMVEITIVSGFVAPMANAGTDLEDIVPGSTVVLDGSASTVDRRRSIKSWAWTSDTVTLTGANTSSPTFTADNLKPDDADVIHMISLVITDDANEISEPDEVGIIITSGFAAPVANAGPDQEGITTGTTVQLDGSASLAGKRRSIKSWAWTSDTVTLINADTSSPTFVADMLEDGDPDVTHEISLRITDNTDVVSDPDTVSITIASDFAVPVANAGPDHENVTFGSIVTLDGSGSTVDRRRTIQSWTWTSDTAYLFDPDTVMPTYFANSIHANVDKVTHIFKLVVTDNAGVVSEVDTVSITVLAPTVIPHNVSNMKPVADAGQDQETVSGTTVTLDGSKSNDIDGEIASWLWNSDSDSVTLTGADTAMPTFIAENLSPGADDITHVFTLTVTDNNGDSATDTISVTISPAPLSEVDVDVSPSELTVQNGGMGVYQVRLKQSPEQDIVIEAFSDNETVIPEKTQLLFDTENWNRWQAVGINIVAAPNNSNNRALIRHRLVSGKAVINEIGSVTVTIRQEDPVLNLIGKHLVTHATTLLDNQPDLIRFLKQNEIIPDEDRKFTLHATDSQLRLNGDGRFVRKNIWGEMTGTYTNSDSGSMSSVLGTFGVHRKYSDNILGGVMLQFDVVNDSLVGNTGSLKGTGWFAGPYLVARHRTHPLYFEGRLLYGQSNNDISFIDPVLKNRTGAFNTRRMLAQARMEGEIALSNKNNGLRLIPYTDVRWMKEKALPFTDNLGNRISGQSVDIRQLELGLNLNAPISVNRGVMTFIGGFGLIRSNTSGKHANLTSRSHGRIETGISYRLNESIWFDFEGFYDGIGSSGHKSHGLSLSAVTKF